MPTTTELKRQNFNVSPEQEAELLALQRELDAPSVKDAIFKAVRLARFLRQEISQGKRLGLKDQNGSVTDVVLPEWQSADASPWTYLVERPHSWKRQLYVKGRRLTAAQVWLDMQTNGMTEKEAAENWDLPHEAITEIIEYSTTHFGLIKMEADEEKLALTTQGVILTA